MVFLRAHCRLRSLGHIKTWLELNPTELCYTGCSANSRFARPETLQQRVGEAAQILPSGGVCSSRGRRRQILSSLFFFFFSKRWRRIIQSQSATMKGRASRGSCWLRGACRKHLPLSKKHTDGSPREPLYSCSPTDSDEATSTARVQIYISRHVLLYGPQVQTRMHLTNMHKRGKKKKKKPPRGKLHGI